MSNGKKFIYLTIILVTCYMKIPFLLEMRSWMNVSYYKIIIDFSKNNIYNFIWFIPVILNIFLISKNMYYKLIKMNPRYKNRKTYYFSIIKDNIKNHIILGTFTILVQIILFTIIFQLPIETKTIFLIFYFKYIIETFLLIMIIVIGALVIDNFIYSIIIVTCTVLVLLNSFKCFYIPFVSLYVNYNINYVDFFIIIILIFILKSLYIKIDLGGVKDENSS